NLIGGSKVKYLIECFWSATVRHRLRFITVYGIQINAPFFYRRNEKLTDHSFFTVVITESVHVIDDSGHQRHLVGKGISGFNPCVIKWSVVKKREFGLSSSNH